jgi:hypothetical protein
MQAEPSNASQFRRQHRRRQRCECPSTTDTLPLMSLHLGHTDVPPPTANVMSKTPPQQCRSTPATALCPNNAMAHPPPPLSLPATDTISTMQHVHHQPFPFCHPDNAVAPSLLPLPPLPQQHRCHCHRHHHHSLPCRPAKTSQTTHLPLRSCHASKNHAVKTPPLLPRQCHRVSVAPTTTSQQHHCVLLPGKCCINDDAPPMPWGAVTQAASPRDVANAPLQHVPLPRAAVVMLSSSCPLLSCSLFSYEECVGAGGAN